MPVAEYNSAPPNLKEITEKEFAQSFMFIWTPTRPIEPRSVNLDQLKLCGIKAKYPLSILMIHHTDGTGVALSSDWHAGKLRYFKFAVCEHVIGTGTKLGNCYYEYTCAKCPHKWRVDSSD